MLNKVPEVTIYFWIIKVLCTTVGETAADYMNVDLGLGLKGTTYVMGAVLLISLAFQFGTKRYRPGVYWFAVVVISIFGTLITDNLVDNYAVALETTTIAFAIALATTFAVWYAFERTLSIHTIYTTRREAFYWLAVLFTFALGTAAGDLMSERLSLGYTNALIIFAGMIAAVAFAHYVFRLNAILSFWLAYILTRPLGASLGDLMSQPTADGGWGLGTTKTSFVFLALILTLVVYLTLTKRDVIPLPAEAELGRQGAAGYAGEPAVLVVTNKATATPSLIDAVRKRAAAGPARFVMLVPNPAHLAFDRVGTDTTLGEANLAAALPLLEEPAGGHIEGRVANSPNAYDDIVDELKNRDYQEIILETPPRHISHWLHIDLPERVARLGYPLTAVAATH
jgi:uncharacterized membrane-anchored protein